MAFFFGDGFDLYALPTDAAAGYWDSSPNASNCALVSGRFSGSRALSLGGTLLLNKTSGVNDSVHHFTFAYMQPSNTTSSNTGFCVTLYDGATPQCSFGIRGDGLIVLIAGNYNGTVLAAYAGPSAVANVWTAYEIELVVHNTNGSMTIRKNGNINNDYYSGLFNTRASANNYANKIALTFYQGIGSSIYIDDFLWRSDAAAVPWSGDIRCYTRRPASDVVAQFSRTTANVITQMWAGVGVTQAFGTNTSAYYLIAAMPYSGLLVGVTLQAGTSASTGHIKVALFSDLNGRVGSVLATAAELTVSNSTPGVGHTLTFPTPVYVTAGQTYWIGLAVDTTTIFVSVVSNPTTVASVAMAYAAFPISNPGAVVGSFNASGLSLTFATQANADAVAELYQDQTINYVYSSVNGQNDLYTIGSIGVTPLQVLGVTTRGYFEKSDSGTRNATVQLKSGGTTVQGPDTALVTTTWNWISRTDVTDPATGAAWTPTAVNGVNIGPKVTQ
jgi:hypothetical protein